MLNRKESYIIIYSKPLTWLLEPLMASNPKRIIEELTGRLHSMRDSYITTQFLTVIQFLIYFKRIVNHFLSIFTMSYNNYFATHQIKKPAEPIKTHIHLHTTINPNITSSNIYSKLTHLLSHPLNQIKKSAGKHFFFDFYTLVNL